MCPLVLHGLYIATIWTCQLSQPCSCIHIQLKPAVIPWWGSPVKRSEVLCKMFCLLFPWSDPKCDYCSGWGPTHPSIGLQLVWGAQFCDRHYATCCEPWVEFAVQGHHECWPVPPKRPLALHLDEGDKLLFWTSMANILASWSIFELVYNWYFYKTNICLVNWEVVVIWKTMVWESSVVFCLLGAIIACVLVEAGVFFFIEECMELTVVFTIDTKS